MSEPCICIPERRREGPSCWHSTDTDELIACRDELAAANIEPTIRRKLTREINRRNRRVAEYTQPTLERLVA